jgi:hypothetical protein
MYNLICFSNIELSEPVINFRSVKSKVKLVKLNGEESVFQIIIKYQNEIKKNHLPIFRLAFTMPLLNYGLFSKKIKLDFSISNIDYKILNELNRIFSRDIYVNKILRRRADYILPEYLPDEKNIKKEYANPKAIIKPLKINNDEVLLKNIKKYRCGILSSGGKESLLTYGLLNEIGCEVYPLYVNESGGHWRTALAAYKYHKKIDNKTHRVWTNIDRFYNHMLDNLEFIRKDHRQIRADTYPIRLCIFPYYVFLLLPIFIDNNIGNILIGSEFDDIRIIPKYMGIKHYYGIYDQHQDYDIIMNEWFSKRIPGLKQWSAVRNISGLIVERILVKRYPNLVKYQRSCHSCHFENNKIVPCGKCSKCLGVLLFIQANEDNPEIIGFKQKHVNDFFNNISKFNLKLDEDEKNQSFYLIGKKNGKYSGCKYIDHVEKIHINDNTCNYLMIPENLRKKLFMIYEEYVKGYCILKNNKWESKNFNNYN